MNDTLIEVMYFRNSKASAILDVLRQKYKEDATISEYRSAVGYVN